MVEDFKDISGKWVRSVNTLFGKKHTISGTLWENVVSRSRDGAEWRRNPNYIGTINLFNNFQEFAEWHTTRLGYNKGYVLDSDMFAPNHKQYAPDTSVLLPQALNTFIARPLRTKGKYPTGMYFDTTRDLLLVQLHHPEGNRYHLGRYPLSCIEKAKEVYAKAKTEAGHWWYKELASGKYEVENRVVEFMKNYKFTHS